MPILPLVYPLHQLGRAALLILLGVSVACHDEKPSGHVYRAPPPAAARVAPPVGAAPAPEIPIGTLGPDARIEAVTDAATGTPVALEEVRGSMLVLTLAARGPYRARDERTTLLLEVRGSSDTTFTVALDTPPPSIVAYAFRIPVGRDEERGLRSGRHSARFRLVAAGDTIASSLPIHFTVRLVP